MGAGFYFGEYSVYADRWVQYALENSGERRAFSKVEANRKVMPVFLKLQNPVYMSKNTDHQNTTFPITEIFNQLGKIPDEKWVDEILERIGMNITNKTKEIEAWQLHEFIFRDRGRFLEPEDKKKNNVFFSQILQGMGYDGMIVDANSYTTDYGRHFVVFSPRQIKSILAKDFDPKSANIYKGQ